MRVNVACLLFSMALAAGLSMAVDDARASDDPVETVIPADTVARPIDRHAPIYPQSAQLNGQEGWVDVSYVVQPDGTVTDVIVDDSSGIRAFERAARRAVSKWTFEPATRNGKPVEQCHTRTRLTFMFEGERGARRPFFRFHEKAMALIEKGAFDEAERLIEQYREKGKWNIYEYARMWLLKALVAQGRGDSRAYLSALHRTVGENGEHIEESLYKKLLPAILVLELQLFDYSGALETYEKIRAFPDVLEKSESLVAVVNQIVDAVGSDRAISVPGTVQPHPDAAGIWGYGPLRREFAFDDIDGSLDRLELRCDWKFFRDAVRPDVSWRIPASWGQCRLYVYGDAGTTFSFIEYPGITEDRIEDDSEG